MKRLTAKEHNLQKTVVSFFKQIGIFCFETDVMDGLKFCSSEKTRVSFINHHKNMGYVKGQPDLILVLPKRIVFLELKNGKKGVQSDSQKEFQKQVEALGWEYFLCRDMQEIQALVRSLRNC